MMEQEVRSSKVTHPGIAWDGALSWLKDCRTGWDVRPLKFAARINPSTLDEDTDPDFEFRYIDISSVDATGRIQADESIRFEKAPSRARRLVRAGDTILATVRTYLKAIAFIEEKHSADVASTGFAVLRPHKDILPRYLWRFVQAEPFVNAVVANSKGVSFPAISPAELGALPVLIPPKEIQRAIANFLDRKTADIDALLAEKQRLLELLEEKRTALITQAVTKGLDPDVEMKDSGVEWLGEIPADWSLTRLRFLTKFVTSGSRGWAQYYCDQGPTFIRIGNLRSVSIDLDFKDSQAVDPPSGGEAERSKVRPGDLLVSITALIGGVGVVPEGIDEAYVNQHVALVRLRQSAANSRWLAYCLLSRVGQMQFKRELYGGTKDGLSLDDVREVLVVLPPVQTQAKVVRYLDENLAALDDLTAEIKSGNTRLHEYRTALISAAVTGKIDVREEAA